jgi:mevalonate kinase
MTIYSSSAPGSLMLFGEHAVLHGKKALCCAVDQRLRVDLTPRLSRQIKVSSPHLGEFLTDLDAYKIVAPFEFVLTAIDAFRSHLQHGFDLTIHAEFASTMGLGSSAAVTVAAIGAITQWLNLPFSKPEIFQMAKTVILRVQGAGSGADAAAAVYGGVVAYRADPLEIETFSFTPDLILIYSGAKVPTRTVIQKIAEKQRAEPQRYQRIYEELDICATKAVTVLQQQNWRELGDLMNQHHALQAALGVSTPLLEELVTTLRAQPQIHGAKISGSGLGDCVVALGVTKENLFPANASQREAGVKPIPVIISNSGISLGALSD